MCARVSIHAEQRRTESSKTKRLRLFYKSTPVTNMMTTVQLASIIINDHELGVAKEAGQSSCRRMTEGHNTDIIM